MHSGFLRKSCQPCPWGPNRPLLIKKSSETMNDSSGEWYSLIEPLVYISVNVGEDCPVFDGMYEFCQLSTGGSVGQYQLLYSP